MVLFYSNDLANRTFKFECDSRYKNENCQFEKDYLFEKLKPVSDLFFNIIWISKESKSVKNMLRFYYYLDNKNYIELLTLILISFPDKVSNELLSLNDDYLSLRRKILLDEFLLREVVTIRKIFGYF